MKKSWHPWEIGLFEEVQFMHDLYLSIRGHPHCQICAVGLQYVYILLLQQKTSCFIIEIVWYKSTSTHASLETAWDSDRTIAIAYTLLYPTQHSDFASNLGPGSVKVSRDYSPQIFELLDSMCNQKSLSTVLQVSLCAIATGKGHVNTDASISQQPLQISCRFFLQV